MPIKYVVTLTSVGSSSVIVMPKPVIEGFGLKKGQKLDMIVTDDGIYLPLKELSHAKEPTIEPTVKERKTR